MLDAFNDTLLPPGMMAKISASLGVIILALCFAVCWYQWKMVRAYRRFPSKRADVEWFLPILLGRLPKCAPLTKVVFQQILKVAEEFRDEGLCVAWFLRPYVFVFREDFTKVLLNDVALGDKGSVYAVNNLIFGNGLLTSKHEIWKTHRKLLNPAFNQSVLKSKMPSLNKYALQMVERVETLVDKTVDDIVEVLKRCAFDNMADFVLNVEWNNERQKSLTEFIMKTAESGSEQFVERIFHPWLYWNSLLPLFPSGRQYLKIIDKRQINRYMRKIMDFMMEKSAASEKDRRIGDSREVGSCGDILMKLYLENPDFTEQDVRDHLVTFVTAGYETVYVSMLWFFYALGRHPEVQEKAFQELQSIVPDGDVTYEDLLELKYLDCVMKETMRLYPTIPVIGRKAREDIQCGKYTIPKGSEVIFVSFMLHRDPNIFPQPEKFDPERFSDGSKFRPWMLIPFSEGYRNCIGKRFAMMEMKVQLAHVLRRFRITCLDQIQDSDLNWTILLKPVKPPRFLLEKRDSKLMK